MTAESLVSGSWHRVAGLKPSLVPGLRIVRQPVRGQVWQMLLEPGSGRQIRLNPAAYDLVGRFDGRATMTELWDRVLRARREAAPTQDETLALLAQLFRAGMVQFDAAPHLSLLFARRAQEGAQRRRGFVNPLFLRTRLGDPNAFLTRLEPLAQAIFRPGVLALWCAAMLWMVLAAATQFPELRSHATQMLASPASLAIAWLCFPVVKALHELGHGLAVRRFGGEVHEVGITLMVLTPAPYVDASAANAFETPARRLAVSAAGIVVELAIAALALALWTLVAPGLVRDVALAVFLICTISTLFFNGNPLLRLDGYYVLCDALQLPNLALRSQAWWGRQVARFTGGAGLPQPLLAPGERKWLMVYAPASWVYRLVLLVALAFWIGQQSWLLGAIAGLLLAAWVAAGAWRWLGSVLPQRRGRVLGAVAALAIGALAVPVPQSVVAQGVVWPAPQAQLRAQAAGFVDEVLVPDGAQVQPRQPVLRLTDPALLADRERIAAQQAGLRAEQYSALLADPSQAQRLQGDIDRNEAELARADERVALLELRPAAAGRLAWLRPADLPGSYARRGALLGHVVVPGASQVRLALPEDDYSRVRGRVRTVEIRLAETPGVVHPARLLPSVPGATHELSVPALADRHGGPIAVEPSDADALRTRAPVFLLDVALDDASSPRLGGRAWVKLALPPEPLASRLARRWSQLFLRQFSASGQL